MDIQPAHKPRGPLTHHAGAPLAVTAKPHRSSADSVDTVKLEAKGYDVYTDPSPWDAQFSPAKLIATEGEKLTLSGVRWGYDENSANSADWTPRFKDTQIDIGKLKDVYIGLEPSLSGHSTLVFEFDEPISSTDGKFQDDRLVLSVEAYRHQDKPYKFWKGRAKNYGLVYQLGSFSDRTQHTSRKIGRPQELRKLSFDSEQKKKLLSHALDESFKDRTGDYYHTTRDSCYTGAQKLVERVVDGGLDRWAVPGGILLKPTMVLPSLTALAFDDRGLLADEPAQLYQPDPELHPDKQRKDSFYDPLVSKLSHKRPTLWKRAFQAAGAGAGIALASGAGLGWIGSIATAAAGAATTGILADHLRLSSGQQYIDPTRFYGPEPVSA